MICQLSVPATMLSTPMDTQFSVAISQNEIFLLVVCGHDYHGDIKVINTFSDLISMNLLYIQKPKSSQKETSYNSENTGNIDLHLNYRRKYIKMISTNKELIL